MEFWTSVNKAYNAQSDNDPLLRLLKSLTCEDALAKRINKLRYTSILSIYEFIEEKTLASVNI